MFRSLIALDVTGHYRRGHKRALDQLEASGFAGSQRPLSHACRSSTQSQSSDRSLTRICTNLLYPRVPCSITISPSNLGQSTQDLSRYKQSRPCSGCSIELKTSDDGRITLVLHFALAALLPQPAQPLPRTPQLQIPSRCLQPTNTRRTSPGHPHTTHIVHRAEIRTNHARHTWLKPKPQRVPQWPPVRIRQLLHQRARRCEGCWRYPEGEEHEYAASWGVVCRASRYPGAQETPCTEADGAAAAENAAA
jgi:hypothetical protein